MTFCSVLFKLLSLFRKSTELQVLRHVLLSVSTLSRCFHTDTLPPQFHRYRRPGLAYHSRKHSLSDTPAYLVIHQDARRAVLFIPESQSSAVRSRTIPEHRNSVPQGRCGYLLHGLTETYPPVRAMLSEHQTAPQRSEAFSPV